MKRTGWYLAAVVMAAGCMMWGTPMSARADVDAEAVQEALADEAVEEEVSRVLVAPTEEEKEEAALAAAQAEEAALLAEAEAAQGRNQELTARQNLVSYALQFVGGPYRAGGTDPHTGADCSGFVKYVMQNGAGITMNRSSRAQATQGRPIGVDQMQPGDLLFYASGGSINHVAMYIGNGQIVHASTYKTGIKTSPWNYRTPVRVVSMF